MACISKDKCGEHIKEPNGENECFGAIMNNLLTPQRIRQDYTDNHQSGQVSAQTRHFLTIKLLEPAHRDDDRQHDKFPELRRTNKIATQRAYETKHLGHQITHDNQIANHIAHTVDTNANVDYNNRFWIKLLCTFCETCVRSLKRCCAVTCMFVS